MGKRLIRWLPVTPKILTLPAWSCARADPGFAQVTWSCPPKQVVVVARFRPVWDVDDISPCLAFEEFTIQVGTRTYAPGAVTCSWLGFCKGDVFFEIRERRARSGQEQGRPCANHCQWLEITHRVIGKFGIKNGHVDVGQGQGEQQRVAVCGGLLPQSRLQ